MAASTRRGRNQHEDPWPRPKPQEREEPPNWKLAIVHIEQALHAAKNPERDTALRDNVEHNLKQALKHLFPDPA